MTSTLKQTLLLTGLALLLGGAAALVHPGRDKVEILLYSAPEQALSVVLAEPGPRLWVDARPRADYERSHVPGALSLSLDTWDEDFGTFLQAWRPGERVVVYCGSKTCDNAQAVARRLGRDLRSRDIRVLKGGWEAWLEKAGATQKETGR